MQVNPLLITSLAVSGLVDIVAPVALAIYLSRRYQGRWRYWWYGVLVFLLFQVVTRIPAMVYFQTRPAVAATLQQPVWFWTFLLFAAFTAGLFEEGGRWVAFRWFVPPADRHWRTALMFGAGHGGLESIGNGLLTLAGLATYLAVTFLPPESFGSQASQIEQARKQFAESQGWEPFLGGWERLGALVIQVALTVLVLQSFLHGGRWWWYALAAHTLVDFTTVALLRVTVQAWGLQTGTVLTEILVGAYALVAFWLIVKLRPRKEETLGKPSTENGAFPPLASGDGQAALNE